MPPGQAENDVRALREAMTVLGDRLGCGVVVMTRGGGVVFATARASRLLGGPGTALPAKVATLGLEIDGDTDVERAHVSLPGTPHRIAVRATRLRGTRHVLVTLTEHAPRASLTKTLIARFGLSARSVQLVQLASQGLKNREIGERMHLSEATVKTYLHGIFRELNVRNRAELVALADRLAIDGAGLPRSTGRGASIAPPPSPI